MRRKSERKSSDASSSAPIRRTTRRSRKSPVPTSNELNKNELQNIKESVDETKELSSNIPNEESHTASSDNHTPGVRSTSPRNKNGCELAIEEKATVEFIDKKASTDQESSTDKGIEKEPSEAKPITNEQSEQVEDLQSQSKETNLLKAEEELVSSKNSSELEKSEENKEDISNNNLDIIKSSSGNVKDQIHEPSVEVVKSSDVCNKDCLTSVPNIIKTTGNCTSEKQSGHSKVNLTKKRKWLSKSSKEVNSHIMLISTDSLKDLISDVRPVPLSDIKLESSSEVEETPEKIHETCVLEHAPQSLKRVHEIKLHDEMISLPKKPKEVVLNDSKIEANMPLSPPKNEPSTVLYITNLVRPFTILQLKGLLGRTGRIAPNGFWIDRIKSKCYVRYETEEEAVETRHALHGVRWPASNPKCLHVDFGDINNLEKAIASTRIESPTFGQDSNNENRIIGTGWDKEYNEEKAQVSRPIREWDVGKKEDFGKNSWDRERTRDFDREKGRDEKVRRRSVDKSKYASSPSPDPKKSKKKENDPPLRLLDDLFRKTTVTPCIYWLPLTPEQIAEKEAFRLKRITEHQERIKQREFERERMLAREKDRLKEKDKQRKRDKDKEKRRDRSDERRDTDVRRY